MRPDATGTIAKAPDSITEMNDLDEGVPMDIDEDSSEPLETQRSNIAAKGATLPQSEDVQVSPHGTELFPLRLKLPMQLTTINVHLDGLNREARALLLSTCGAGPTMDVNFSCLADNFRKFCLGVSPPPHMKCVVAHLGRHHRKLLSLPAAYDLTMLARAKRWMHIVRH